jgi:hypothetical protein
MNISELNNECKKRITIHKFRSHDGIIEYELAWQTIAGIYLSRNEALQLVKDIIEQIMRPNPEKNKNINQLKDNCIE